MSNDRCASSVSSIYWPWWTVSSDNTATLCQVLQVSSVQQCPPVFSAYQSAQCPVYSIQCPVPSALCPVPNVQYPTPSTHQLLVSSDLQCPVPRFLDYGDQCPPMYIAYYNGPASNGDLLSNSGHGIHVPTSSLILLVSSLHQCPQLSVFATVSRVDFFKIR